mgnify:CR=1 FL=1
MADEFRKLASIQIINNIEPIEGKDRIVLAHVLGWDVIVKKDEFKIGDKCVYIEIDSQLPEDNPDFEFLRNKKFRIKTMKLGNVYSQGIVFPLSILPQDKKYEVNDDVTDILKIKKYDPQLEEEKELNKSIKPVKKYPQFLMKFAWFRKLVLPSKRQQKGFPMQISKTDEIRCQVVPDILQYKEPMVVTEKIDGSSLSALLIKTKTWFGKTKYEFILCSRNLRLWTPDGSYYWEMAKKYNLEETLKRMIGDNEWVAIQGEVYGASIQKNPYKMNSRELRVFNLIYPSGRLGSIEAKEICEKYGLMFVPILDENFVLPDTVDEMLKYATEKSVINPDVMREGVVVRSKNGKRSFKAVSPEYLLKYEE